MKILAPYVLFFLIVGCAGFQLKSDQETAKQFAKVAVQYSVVKVVKNNPSLNIESELLIIQNMLETGNPVEVARKYAIDRVAGSGLEPEDKVLILNLVDIASNSIVVVSENDSTQERAIAIEVIKWIREALNATNQ